MGFMRKQYAEKHQQELNEFAKAVRYMNANGIKAADQPRIADELQLLLNEQTQLRAALAEQNVDPDLIDRIRYCIDTVIKAGEEPRPKVSIREQLKTHQNQTPRPNELGAGHEKHPRLRGGNRPCRGSLHMSKKAIHDLQMLVLNSGNAFADMRLLVEGAITLYEDDTESVCNLMLEQEDKHVAIAFDTIGTAESGIYRPSCAHHLHSVISKYKLFRCRCTCGHAHLPERNTILRTLNAVIIVRETCCTICQEMGLCDVYADPR